MSELWDAEAATFDDEPDHGLRDPEVREAWRRLLRDHLPEPPARVADLGCGTGTLSVLLADEGYAVDGVDFSPEMVREAQSRATSERERYVAADASALPFADEAFDLVTLLNMIPFYDELARVTARGGTVVLAYSRGAQTPIWVPFDRSGGGLQRRGFAGFREVVAGSGKSLLAVRGSES